MTKKGKQRGRQGKVSFVLQYQKKCWKSLMLMLARTSTFTDCIWTRQYTISKNELFSLWYLQKKYSLGPTQKEKHPKTKNAHTHPPTHTPTHTHTHIHTHTHTHTHTHFLPFLLKALSCVQLLQEWKACEKNVKCYKYQNDTIPCCLQTSSQNYEGTFIIKIILMGEDKIQEINWSFP